ncbi:MULTISPECIES: DinB family protein [Aquimarina]|uniref:DinB family protein n=1 Tax=Aquimarina TaxID=290174 RepID=UPI000D6973E3|nr:MULTISPECIES: DinB family protein [Aquimarina]
MNKSNFSISYSIEILESTPKVVNGLLKGKSGLWIQNNEGKGTWSPIMVLKHLILAEKNNWIPRIEIILTDRINKTYKPFERQENTIEQQSLDEILMHFNNLRVQNIKKLKSKKISEDDLNRTAIHPDFGEVTLAQQISAWCVHDLGHISQICRTMAFQYKEEIGPWKNYISIVGNKR